MSQDEKVTVVTPQCVYCNQTSEVFMTMDQYILLTSPNRMHIQDILPGWSNEMRELLITGTHPSCWEAIFKGAEVEG